MSQQSRLNVLDLLTCAYPIQNFHPTGSGMCFSTTVLCPLQVGDAGDDEDEDDDYVKLFDLLAVLDCFDVVLHNA